jgi:hypothetical protein
VNVPFSDFTDDALRQANERYRARHAQLEEHLRKVLAYTRALAEEVRQ